MHTITLDDWICGGYLITRPVPRTSWRSAGLIPDPLLTVSSCIAEFIPDAWAWAVQSSGDIEDDRRTAAAYWGLSPAQQADLITWAAEHFNIAFGASSVWYTLNAAQQFAHRFLAHNDDITILGIGLPQGHTVDFLEDEKPTGSQGSPGIYEMLSRGELLADTGTVLGIELLAFNYDSFHSWLCYSLEKDVAQELAISPNARGFLNTVAEAEAARAVVKRVNDDRYWLPWAVVQYPLQQHGKK